MLAASLALLAGSAQGQSPATLRAFETEPHLTSAERALVQIESVTTDPDGARSVRHANGFLLRCDGFILAPALCLPRKTSSQKQTIVVTLYPGTDHEQKREASQLPGRESAQGFKVVKIPDIHAAAVRTVLPDQLKPGDELTLLWRGWDADGHAGKEETRRAKIGQPAKDDKDWPAGMVSFEEVVTGAPAGTLVLGPDRMCVGVLPGSGEHVAARGFVSFTYLNTVTACVSPVPCTDGEFESMSSRAGAGPSPAETAQTGRSEPQKEEAPPTGMVAVPGGPVLPPKDWAPHTPPEMLGAYAACVAPFQIDTYQVTNEQYLQFWKTLPADDKRRRAYFPLGWSPEGDPFGPEVASVPVLGVTYDAAEAYAHWRGKRLPTAYEWCLAALGPKCDHEWPEWLKRYAADRQATWERILARHADYARHRPDGNELMVMLVNPLCIQVPWVTRYEGLLDACDWSREVVEEETSHLYADWDDPPFVLPIGSRRFDVSPYGAHDMLMNGGNIVTMPWPGTGDRSSIRALYSSPTVPLYIGEVPPDLAAFTYGGGRLSLLVWRARPGIPSDEIVIGHNIALALVMSHPIGLRLSLTGAPATTVPFPATGVAVEHGTATSGLIHVLFPYTFPTFMAEPDPHFVRMIRRWGGRALHFRQEMGRRVPIDWSEPVVDPPPSSQWPRLAVHGQLLRYLGPVGFRCAR